MPIMLSAALPCRLCHLAVFGIALLVSSPLKVRGVQNPPAPANATAETERLTATGGLSAHTVGVDERVRLWLTVGNPASRSIYDVRLLVQLEPSDYDIEGIYKWTAQPGQSTANQQRLGSGGEQLIAYELKPGENIGVWAYIRPRTSHDTTTLNGLVSWKGAEGNPSQLFVPLGDLKVLGVWDPTYQLIKDFALPLVVLLLPFIIQWKAQKRARLTETWNLMLPESHRAAMTYYMPLQASLDNAQIKFASYKCEPVPARKTEHARAMFYYLLVFRRRLKHLTDNLGGFYFKDRIGEKLAIRSLRELQELYPGKVESDKVATGKILKHLDIHETLDSFEEKLDGTSPQPRIRELKPLFQERWQNFYVASDPALGTEAKGWLAGKEPDKAIVWLKVFKAIIEYEMNRPYEHWYGKKEVIHTDDTIDRKLGEIAGKVAEEEERPDFPKEVREYLREGKKNTGGRMRLVRVLETDL